MIDKAKFDADLLELMADLSTLPLPQQTMVWGHVMGVCAGAMMAQKGWTKLEAQRWVLDRMMEKIVAVRPN